MQIFILQKFKMILMNVVRALPFVALLMVALNVSAQEDGRPASATASAVPIGQAAAPSAEGLSQIGKIRSFREGDVFTAELQTKTNWTVSEVQLKFAADFVQIDLPNMTLEKAKADIKVDDRIFKSISILQSDSSLVRARFILHSGLSARGLDGQVRVRRHKGSVTIEVAGDPIEVAADDLKDSKQNKKIELARTIVVSEEDGSVEGMSAKLIAGSEDDLQSLNASTTESGPVGVAKPEAKERIDTNKLKESEIPVLANAKELKKGGGSQVGRLMLTLGVLAAALGGLLLILKRLSARGGKANQSTKIQVLTQHYLGPKKSLAIIQVAGESILVGITDHNISMLKTLSLIDDEVPEHLPHRFDGALDDFVDDDDQMNERAPNTRRSNQESEHFAMKGLSEIRDTVSGRLRNLRNQSL